MKESILPQAHLSGFTYYTHGEKLIHGKNLNRMSLTILSSKLEVYLLLEWDDYFQRVESDLPEHCSVESAEAAVHERGLVSTYNRPNYPRSTPTLAAPSRRGTDTCSRSVFWPCRRRSRPVTTQKTPLFFPEKMARTDWANLWKKKSRENRHNENRETFVPLSCEERINNDSHPNKNEFIA